MFSLLLYTVLWFLPSNLAFAAESPFAEVKIPRLPNFVVSWLDDKHDFRAGDIATIKIKLMEDFDNGNRSTDRFTLTANGKMGNSSYVSGVSLSANADSTNWNMTFIPIMVGDFQVAVNDCRSGISDESLHFSVTAGPLYPSVCIASWMNLVNEFVAGTRANVLILPKDAFGNNISSMSEGPHSNKFTVSAFYENGSSASVLDVTYMGRNEFGYIGIGFVSATAGSLSLHVEGENKTLNGSPLLFKVKPGPLDITKCLAKWNYETNALQIFSKLELFIYQQDQYGNLVAGLYAFDARVVQKTMNLSIPIADLYFQEMAQGIQLLSFSVYEPGEFMLTIFDDKQNESISHMQYDYTVFVGYCNGLNSVINGSGLAGSVAGQMSYFSVYLEDVYRNPAPVEVEQLHVQITRIIDSYSVRPSILPMKILYGNEPAGEHTNGAISHAGAAPAQNTSSAFNVIFTPEKSGSYEILVFCGNIPLNGGRPYLKEVSPAMVDTSLSSVVKFAPNVTRLVRNDVIVELMDQFSNPVLSQHSKLSLKTGPVNNSGFLRWRFVDNEDGSYVGYYLARDLGSYNICVSFEDKSLSPCPFEVNVYKREYFPQVNNDTISVWENESLAFDALANDYFADGNASIIESSTPNHGSLLLYGQLFRYTPYKGFFGNDSFSYTIADVNKNFATATIMISVLTTPPQFVSLPVLLQVTEDAISPRFGGFPGFEIKYSDQMENISVTLSALSGTVFLAPTPMQFWKPSESGFSVNKGERAGEDLILVGRVEVINSALQLIQYLGNENFYGDDVITVSAINKNGVQDAHVPVSVEPINDPPFIRAPKYIILEAEGAKDGSQIFDKQNDTFEFSVGDPDLINFPGNKSHFVVTLSVEVNDGIIMTNLPADLINSTELKLENSYQWLPLQTFVTISNHFWIKGKGFRFRGTIEDCNNAIQQLLYQGAEHGAVLSVTVNDMGNYGCYPDCTESMSLPLFTEATINLIKRRPMSSLIAHSLGSAIIIEFITMLLLGVILLHFICKCAIALGNERSHYVSDIKLTEEENLDKPTLSATSSENVTYFTGCSSSFLLRSHSSNFRQRSRRLSRQEESSNGNFSAQFSNDHHQQSPHSSCLPLAIERGPKET
ncbi:gamete expressed 2 [Tasmannia lanceolata]|uniref:gamete expressed 2 n=1 Tax=Tasmannia lanceolata TaxID=3420 RepID=UPI004064BF8F